VKGCARTTATSTFSEIDGKRENFWNEHLLQRRNRPSDAFHVLRRGVMIRVMSSGRGEAVQQWYERAIVAHSMAAAQEEAIAEAGNPIAKRVARKRAEEAAGDLQQALQALKTERRRVS
jgi:hypothetical protein